jgi:nucleoside-diphosphate-sugar epimerase
MKILIIGSGFLGTSIFEKLDSEGHDLLIFSRTRSERIQNRHVLGDIFDFNDFFKVLDWKPQVVIHTAWITTPGMYKNDVSNFKYAAFTTNLAAAIAHSNVEHLMILGTCAEYGVRVGPKEPSLARTSPPTIYAQQKVIAFNSAKELLQDSEVKLTWARVFYPYGQYQDPRRLIPSLINSLKKGEPAVLADTTSIYDWITTRDIASAISWILKNDLPMEIDVGTSLGHSNLEIVLILERLLKVNRHPASQRFDEFGLNEVFVANKNSPLFTSGWSPSDSLDTGLEWVLNQ